MGEFALGQPVSRFEDQRLLKGGGRYVDDLKLPGMAYGVVLRSPHAHARFGRGDGVGGGGQGIVVNLDQLGGVAGLLACLGNDHGHTVADMANGVFGQSFMHGGSKRRAVAVGNGGETWNGIDAVGP